MVQKMLIDAAHPEETRVAVIDGNKLEDFDYETSAKKQLRGNIYLAKVTRVEPSLQAAFVEYGGNRHGFLAFNEIHPDYYQIPFEDRQRLLEAEQEAHADDEDDHDEAPAPAAKAAPSESGDSDDTGHDEHAEDGAANEDGEDDHHDEAGGDAAPEAPVEAGGTGGHEDDEEEAERIAEQAAKRRRRAMRSYKIQEVIKRRQVLLVQVVKEERGNKGAALTTYLSLAGRYCVLMPNTHRGGGISRKISDSADRRRLKEVVDSLNLAEGMGVIIRTAGFSRTKAEIKRDYEYLLRLWERIREETLKSSAPSLIYEEGNLIKRAIRDLYDKDIESILVEGDEAYRQAKDFMRVLIPSHAKKVQPYKDRTPLFMKHQVETQIDQVYQPVVQLKSGGYLVINQTEALVAIDVNSGRSTRERNIEATALKTNLEAADEACRQMRLRDLAGLIVIDFIDMEENKNNRAVEKRLRDALKVDRSRVQVGKISQFGLLEMSRQRRRSSVFEGSTEICPHCQGTGFVRSNRSAALHVLRALEEEALKKRSALVRIKAPANVALYLLNEKRDELLHFETTFGMRAHIEVDATLTPPDFKLERLEALTAPPPGAAQESEPAHSDAIDEDLADEAVERGEDDRPAGEVRERNGERGERGGRRRRRRRGRGGGGGAGERHDGPNEAGDSIASAQPEEHAASNADGFEAEGDEDDAEGEGGEIAARDGNGDGDANGERKRRRRGRRGGRGRRRREGEGEAGAEGEAPVDGMDVVEPQEDEALSASDTSGRARPRPHSEPETADESGEEPDATGLYEPEVEVEVEAEAAPDVRPEPEPEAPVAVEPAPVIDFPEAAPIGAPVAETPAAPQQPVKRGWWQKRSGE